MTERDALLPAIQAGDSDAFARWVAGAELRIRLSLARYAAACDTEAVLQETLLRVWQVAPRVEPDGPDALLRFAIRVARNTAVSELRRVKSAPVEPFAEETCAPIEPDPLLARAIAFCRERLKGKPGLALEARLSSEGADDVELAHDIGMTLNTFLQNVTRARKALLACLARKGVRLEEVPP